MGARLSSKKPTITDVARRAGVSVGTVSNVLNGAIKVSESRRERVMGAIRELDYTQNMLAQGLRRRRSPVIGLCVPNTSIAYFAALVDAFEEVAANHGFEIMQVLSRHDPRKERQRVNALLRYHVGGLILVPGMEPEGTYQLIADSGIPVVVVDRPTGDYAFDEVTFDNRGAMFEAVSGLIGFGHKRILFVVKERLLSITVQRSEGLRRAADRAGPAVTATILECGDDQPTLATRLGAELKAPRPPSVIIVSNSTIAAWTLRALHGLGVSCPEEVSLIAFDEPEWADLVTPPLSVVRQPTREIARMAWACLLRRMKNEADGVQRIQLQAEVVFRDSVRPPAAKPAQRRAG
jgi:LacI family transcriptional regulator